MPMNLSFFLGYSVAFWSLELDLYQHSLKREVFVSSDSLLTKELIALSSSFWFEYSDPVGPSEEAIFS